MSDVQCRSVGKYIFQNFKYQKPTKFIVTLKPRTVDVPGKVCTNYWSPRLKSDKIRRVVVESSDVFNGNPMLELNHSVKLHQLDYIEEDSECSKSNTDLQNHELRATHSLTDITRLGGGCIEFMKKRKTKQTSSQNLHNLQKRLDESQISNKQSFKYHKNKFDRSDKEYASDQKSDVSLQRVCDDHTHCDRIEELEKQIMQMYGELNDIRKHMVPPQDVDKFSAISKNLNEIHALLSEVKFNCLRLQQSDDDIKEQQSSKQNENKSTYRATSGRNLQCTSPEYRTNKPEYIIHSYRKSQMARCKGSEKSKYNCSNIADGTANKPRSKNECVSNFPLRRQMDCILPQRCISYTNCLIHCSSQTTSSLFSDTDLKQGPHICQYGCDTIQICTPNETLHCSNSSGRRLQPQTLRKYGNRIAESQIKRCEVQKPSNCATVHKTPLCASASSSYYKCEYLQQPMDSGKQQSRHSETISPLLGPSKHDCQLPTKTCTFKKSIRKSAMNDNRQQIFQLSSACEKTSSSCMPTNSADTSTSYNRVMSPIVRENLLGTILDIINTIDHTNIALTVMMTRKNVYHINISVTHTGQSLGDIYATVTALRQAEREHLLDNFLTFFVLTSNSHLDEENTIFGHSYEFIKTDSCQTNFNTDCSLQSQYEKQRRRPKPKKSMKYRTANRDCHRTCNLHGNTYQENPREFANESINFSYDNKIRLKGGSSNEGIDKSKHIQESLSATEQLLKTETPNKRNVVEGRDNRLEYLEQQVVNLRLELNQIREALVPQEDVIKFSNLSDRLKELNALLKDLRNNYHREQITKNEGLNRKPSLANIAPKDGDKRERNEEVLRKGSDNLLALKGDKEIIKLDNRDINPKVFSYVNEKQNESKLLSPSSASNYAPSTSAECQKFLDEIKHPKNLFERHLLMMKDFRTDADLRRQRLERKRREQLLQRQGNKSTLSNNQKDVEITQDKVDEEKIERSENDVTAKSLNAKGKTDASNNQPVTHTDKSEHLQWNSLCLPQVLPIETATSATQTDDYLNETFMPELSRHKSDGVSSESDTNSDHTSKTSDNDLGDNGLNYSLNKPIIQSNLYGAIHDILNELNLDHTTIILTIVLESDHLYHINITTTSSGQSLGYLYATEEAIQEAQDRDTFSSFLIFFVVNAKNSLEQKHRLLGHSFEIMKLRK